MNEKLISGGTPTNMLWKLFRLAVENEEVPEETSQEMRRLIKQLRTQES